MINVYLLLDFHNMRYIFLLAQKLYTVLLFTVDSVTVYNVSFFRIKATPDRAFGYLFFKVRLIYFELCIVSYERPAIVVIILHWKKEVSSLLAAFHNSIL